MLLAPSASSASSRLICLQSESECIMCQSSVDFSGRAVGWRDGERGRGWEMARGRCL